MRSSAWLKPSARGSTTGGALGAQDGGLLLALGDVDVRLPRALRLGDDGAPVALGREHPVHRVLDVARRDDLADLDRRDLAAPALGLLVELGAQDLVDLLALGSTSSSRMSPMTARRVVVAMPCSAPAKFWTFTMARSGSTMYQ